MSTKAESQTSGVRQPTSTKAGKRLPRRRASPVVVLLVAILTLGGLIATSAPASAGVDRASIYQCVYDRGAPTLRPGSQGDCTAAVQYILQIASSVHDDSRYYPGRIDGIFGRQTERAVRFLQATYAWTYPQYSYSVDGIVGLQTWGMIANECGRMSNNRVNFCRDFSYEGVSGP
jgi:peptidoglycan hydrolase-like protein with peptidoglycan-binding domain